ncbi:MAG: type II toxin-antitoxin system RelE/ParE family toxin [Nitrospinota bacterium]
MAKRVAALKIRSKAAKALEGLPVRLRLRIRERLLALAEDPRPRGCRKMKGDVFRVRQGDWRIFYRVDDRRKEVLVEAIRHRREAYRS